MGAAGVYVVFVVGLSTGGSTNTAWIKISPLQSILTCSLAKGVGMYNMDTIV